MGEAVNGNDKAKKSSLNIVKDWLAKVDPKAKVKILLAIAVIAVIVVVGVGFVGSVESSQTVSGASSSSYYVSSLDYCAKIENRLKEVLSGLDGVDNIDVMVTLSSSMELVFATTNNQNNNSIFGSSTSTSDNYSPIIVDNNGKEEPLVVKEILPKIKGVLVVCSGANNINTKLNIIYAIKSLLDIDMSSIQVLSK